MNVQQLNLFAPMTVVAVDHPCGWCSESESHREHRASTHGGHRYVGETYAERFHKANPQVMELLAVLSRRARARVSAQRIGFRMVWETARWLYIRKTRDDSGFRLNNNLQSWYARQLMLRYPELAGVFETRDRQVA